MQIADSVAIVTGASAGIGAATVAALAQAGGNVVLSARRQERLDALVEQLAAFPGQRIAIAGDIQDEAYCHRLVAETVARFGRIDILINNAGLGHTTELAEMPADDMRTLINTNILGLMFATQAALGPMRAAGRGHIINVSSIVSQRPLPRGAFYAGTKTMVNFLTRGLRMELRGSGIVLSTLYPGLTDTEFHTATLGGSRPWRRNARGIAPERVAQATLTAIEKARTEIYVTWYDWLFTHANRLFPRTIDALLPPILNWIRPSAE